MTKQEEIREKQDKILNLVKAWAVIPHPYESRDAEGLLYSLSREGVVIKVDRELPDGFICDDFMNGLGWLTEHDRTPTYLELDRFIRALGYVAVEPLIEDGKDNSGK